MDTEILLPNKANIKRAAKLIRAGEIVAFPTETVYGLGASVFNESAVKKIYIAKGRPSDNPLIVHISSIKQIADLAVSLPESGKKLIEKFMPGAITIILKKKPSLPTIVTGGKDTVGIRMPKCIAALDFIKECGVPICAPSANTSTRPSPTTAQHVLKDLNGKIPCVIDGGSCLIGLESTIVDLTVTPPRLLRLGGVSIEDIEAVIGKVEVVRSSTEALCPGMKYKHYSPKAEVFFSAFYDSMFQTINNKYDKLAEEGKNPVIMGLSTNAAKYGSRNFIELGNNYEQYAHNMFAVLRKADELLYNSIIAEGVSLGGIGGAIINRLVKSSGGQII